MSALSLRQDALAQFLAGAAQHLDFEKWIFFVEAGDDRLVVAGGGRGVPDDFLVVLGAGDERSQIRLRPSIGGQKTARKSNDSEPIVFSLNFRSRRIRDRGRRTCRA